MPRKPRRNKAHDVEDPRWRSPLPPAPGELRLVQAFLVTAAAWKKPEELTDPEVLAAWLELWELIRHGTEIGKDELRRALAVRQSLRAMIRARAGKADPQAAEILDREAREARLRPRFQADGGVRYEVAAEGFEGALSRIFDAVRSAQLDGSWSLFKLCADPKYGQAFYDYSTNHSTRWCQETCGNRRSAAATGAVTVAFRRGDSACDDVSRLENGVNQESAARGRDL